jgi:hypothetical protein
MCNSKFKAGDRVVIADCRRHGTVMFVDPNAGLYPVLVVFDPKEPGHPHGSSWLKESELRLAPVKVTSEKYRRLLYRTSPEGPVYVAFTVREDAVSVWEKDKCFLGWIDKDWITSEIEVTPR